jgi:hypothetical protein
MHENILEPARLAPTIIPRSVALPILTFNRSVTECLAACLPALYSKPRPHDSLSVGAHYFGERSGVPNKLLTALMALSFPSTMEPMV